MEIVIVDGVVYEIVKVTMPNDSKLLMLLKRRVEQSDGEIINSENLDSFNSKLPIKIKSNSMGKFREHLLSFPNEL